MVKAWFMDSSDEDQRLPHQLNPPEPVSLDYIAEFGVLYWHIDADSYEANPEFEKIKRERGYTYTDKITISPDRLPEYEKKLKIFFEEHLHTDEEIRYILEGSGYFDVRDRQDRWIRIAVEKGDMLVLPAGIYHRFTLDDKNYLAAMRLFVGNPVWTPWNRKDDGVDAMPERKKYISAA